MLWVKGQLLKTWLLCVHTVRVQRGATGTSARDISEEQHQQASGGGPRPPRETTVVSPDTAVESRVWGLTVLADWTTYNENKVERLICALDLLT